MPFISLAAARSCVLLFMVSCTVLHAEDTVLTLQKSADGLGTWQSVPVTRGMVNSEGKLNAGTVGGLTSGFYRLRIEVVTPSGPTPAGMVEVQGGTLPASSQLAGETVQSFYIGVTSITWDEWQEVRSFAVANGYDLAGRGAGITGNHPVTRASWFDAVKWCNARSEKEGLTPVYLVNGNVYKTGQFEPPTANPQADGYRLPADAEWEWAARGGTLSQGFTYSGSNVVGDVAWFSGNASAPQPVKMKSPNELGLYDMSGNVWEWCFEPYTSSTRRVRGGSYTRTASSCAISYRDALSQTWSLSDDAGTFRVVRKMGD